MLLSCHLYLSCHLCIPCHLRVSTHPLAELCKYDLSSSNDDHGQNRIEIMCKNSVKMPRDIFFVTRYIEEMSDSENLGEFVDAFTWVSSSRRQYIAFPPEEEEDLHIPIWSLAQTAYLKVYTNMYFRKKTLNYNGFELPMVRCS